MASSVAVNILNLVPVFGVLGAVVINAETVRPAQVFGGVVIVAGVTLGSVEHRSPAGKVAVPRTDPGTECVRTSSSCRVAVESSSDSAPSVIDERMRLNR